MSETNALRVADHFPRSTKACKKVADTFFTCFGEKSKQPIEGDANACTNGLAQCLNEMKAYDACMQKNLPKQTEYYRVPDVYRDRKD